MGRRHTGLRNRFRTGRSTYSVERKSRTADRYGQYSNGKQIRADVIAGSILPLHDVWRRNEIRTAELVF
jgi:hypothetical protein